MANQEHLDILEQGINAWNVWRAQHEEVQPDLSGADLSGADFTRANFTKTDLSGANLIDAKLSGANLIDADLSFAKLNGAKLNEARFSRAKLIKAKLNKTHLFGAKLDGADLSGADLTESSLFVADLSGANLRGAKLNSALLYGVNLMETDFSEVKTWLTSFTNTDLSTAKGLTTIHHDGPSSIGIDTFFRSQGKIPERFLRDAGVPDTFLDYMHSIVNQPIQYFTCFISHSTKDKHFCDRLYADLRNHDVPSWYFPEDATWGKSVWGEIDRSIKIYDKLVVVCSEHSLQSGPVLREIERALQREDREGKHILFPLRIDNYLFEQWGHERKTDVVSKVAGDFRGWENSAEKYGKSFQKFLKALKAQKEIES